MKLANHRVVNGETLTSIAARYRTTISELQRLNPFIKNANYVQADWNLSVPAPASDSATVGTTSPASPVASAAPASDGAKTAIALDKEPSVPDGCKAPAEDAPLPCATTYATAIYATEEQQFWLLPETLSEAIQEALQELANSISPEKSPEERKRGLDEQGLLEYFMEPKLTNFLEGEDLERAQAIEREVPDIADFSRAWQRIAEQQGLPLSPFNRPPVTAPFSEEGRAAAREFEENLPRVRPVWNQLASQYEEWKLLEAKALLQAKEEGYTYEDGKLFSKEAIEARRRVQDYLSKRSQVLQDGELPSYSAEKLAETLATAKARYQAVQDCTKQCRGKVKSYNAWLRASRGKLDFIDYVDSIIKVADYGLALPEFALIPASEQGEVNAGVAEFREYLDAQRKQKDVNDRLQTKYRNWIESTGSNMRPPAGLVAAERAEWEALQKKLNMLEQQAEANVKNAATQRHLLWAPEQFQARPAERLVRAGFPLREMSLPDNPESPVRALSLFNLEGMAEQLKKDLKNKPTETFVEGIQRIPVDTGGKVTSAKSLFEVWLENAGGYKIEDQESDWFDEDGWFEMEKFYAYLQQNKLKVSSLEDAAVRTDWGLRLKQVLFSADIRDEIRLFDPSPQAQLVRCLTPPQSNIHRAASATGPSFSVAEGFQASAQASLGIDLARGEVELFSVDYPERSAAKDITVHYQHHAGESLPMSLGRYSMHLSARAWGYAGAALLLAAKIEITPNGPLWGKPALTTEEPATRPNGPAPRTVSHTSTHTSTPVTTGRGPSVNVQDGAQASFNLFAGVQAGILLTGALNWAPPKGLAAMRTIPGRQAGSVETSDANQWISMAVLTGGLGAGLGLGIKGDAAVSLHNGRLVLKLKGSALAGAGINGEFSFELSYQGVMELITIYRRELHRNHGRPLDWVYPEAAELIAKINVLSAVGLDAEFLLMAMWPGHLQVTQVDMIMTLYESLLSRPGRAGGVALAIMTYRNLPELEKWFVEAVPEALGPLLLTLSSRPRSFSVTETKVTPEGVRTHTVEYTSEQAQALQQRAIDRVLGWIVTAARANNSMPAAQHQFEQACMRMSQYGVLPEETGQTYCENRLKLDLFMEKTAAGSDDPLIVSAKIRYKKLVKLLGAQADRHCKISESRLPFFNPSASYEPQ